MVNLICVFLKFKFCSRYYESLCTIKGWRMDSLCARVWDTVPAKHTPQYMRCGVPEVPSMSGKALVLEPDLEQASSRFEIADDCTDLVVSGFVNRQWERLENEQPTPTLTPAPTESGEIVYRTKSLRDTRLPAEGVLEIIKRYCGPCRLESENISSILYDMMGRA